MKSEPIRPCCDCHRPFYSTDLRDGRCLDCIARLVQSLRLEVARLEAQIRADWGIDNWRASC